MLGALSPAIPRCPCGCGCVPLAASEVVPGRRRLRVVAPPVEADYAPAPSELVVPSASLDQLMARLADGDRTAFAGVFRELWPRVRGLCASLLKNNADAEDAAQRAMEKVLTRAADYEPGRPALTWALAIAAWECRTVLRSRQRRREVSADVLAELPEGPAGDAEQRFIGAELERAALAALGTLSDADRAALAAAYWEEAASGDAAARKRRQRAVERLRLAFRRLYGAD